MQCWKWSRKKHFKFSAYSFPTRAARWRKSSYNPRKGIRNSRNIHGTMEESGRGGPLTSETGDDPWSLRLLIGLTGLGKPKRQPRLQPHLTRSSVPAIYRFFLFSLPCSVCIPFFFPSFHLLFFFLYRCPTFGPNPCRGESSKPVCLLCKELWNRRELAEIWYLYLKMQIRSR